MSFKTFFLFVKYCKDARITRVNNYSPEIDNPLLQCSIIIVASSAALKHDQYSNKVLKTMNDNATEKRMARHADSQTVPISTSNRQNDRLFDRELGSNRNINCINQAVASFTYLMVRSAYTKQSF